MHVHEVQSPSSIRICLILIQALFLAHVCSSLSFVLAFESLLPEDSRFEYTRCLFVPLLPSWGNAWTPHAVAVADFGRDSARYSDVLIVSTSEKGAFFRWVIISLKKLEFK